MFPSKRVTKDTAQRSSAEFSISAAKSDAVVGGSSPRKPCFPRRCQTSLACPSCAANICLKTEGKIQLPFPSELDHSSLQHGRRDLVHVCRCKNLGPLFSSPDLLWRPGPRRPDYFHPSHQRHEPRAVLTPFCSFAHCWHTLFPRSWSHYPHVPSWQSKNTRGGGDE